MIWGGQIEVKHILPIIFGFKAHRYGQIHYYGANCYVTIAALIVISQSSYSLLSSGLGHLDTMSCFQNAVTAEIKVGIAPYLEHRRTLVAPVICFIICVSER